MWALGAILYNMIYGYPPNYSTQMLEFQNKLKKWEGVNAAELLDRGYSDELVSFLDGLL